MMKNIVTLSLILAFNFLAPARSQAAIGVLIGAPVTMAILGLVPQCYVNASALCGFQEAFDKSKRTFRDRVLILMPYLVSLDAEGSKVQFKAVSPATAGVSSQDAEIFNSELDQLNAVLDLIAEETEKNSLKDTSSLWETYGHELNPVTLDVARTLILSK